MSLGRLLDFLLKVRFTLCGRHDEWSTGHDGNQMGARPFLPPFRVFPPILFRRKGDDELKLVFVHPFILVVWLQV